MSYLWFREVLSLPWFPEKIFTTLHVRIFWMSLIYLQYAYMAIILCSSVILPPQCETEELSHNIAATVSISDWLEIIECSTAFLLKKWCAWHSYFEEMLWYKPWEPWTHTNLKLLCSQSLQQSHNSNYHQPLEGGNCLSDIIKAVENDLCFFIALCGIMATGWFVTSN